MEVPLKERVLVGRGILQLQPHLKVITEVTVQHLLLFLVAAEVAQVPMGLLGLGT